MNRRLTLTDSFVSSVASGSPPVLAVTLDYVKQHVRALGSTDDDLLTVWIAAATSYFEEQTGRQVLLATREAWIDAFPFVGATGGDARIELPYPPLRSVTDVQYVDESGATQSFAAGSPLTKLYSWKAPVGDYCHRGTVEPLFGRAWPTARRQSDAVRITYSCGYAATAAEVPTLVRGILCYLVAHFDTFRSPTLAGTIVAANVGALGVKALLDGFKYSAYPTQALQAYGCASNAPFFPWVAP